MKQILNYLESETSKIVKTFTILVFITLSAVTTACIFITYLIIKLLSV